MAKRGRKVFRGRDRKQVAVYLLPEEFQLLEAIAETEHRSLNGQAVHLIMEGIARYKAATGIALAAPAEAESTGSESE